MTYNDESALMRLMGLESWRNLSKDKIFQLLEMWPEVDKDVATEIVKQVPEISSVSKTAMADIEATYKATLEASTQSLRLLSEAIADERAAIRAALATDPTNEALWGRLRELTEVLVAKDSEVREFAGRLNDVRVIEKLALSAVALAAVFVGFKTGSRKASGVGRAVSAVRSAA